MTDTSEPASVERRRHWRRPREPLFNLPGVILACCLVLIGINAARAVISVETDNQIVASLAFMPARVSIALHLVPSQLTAVYSATVDRNPLLAAQIDFLIGDGHLRSWTFVTYALLHGSWAHVGFNCLWLAAFGSAVARRFTTVRFLLLMLVAAFAGAVVEYAADLSSFQIVIGASAAVSGAMGAATRFMFRPDDDPPWIFGSGINQAFRLPALTLRQTFATKTALMFILVWFGTNVLFGYFPWLGGTGDGPVAWQAHIGGFLVGLLLFPLFDKRAALASTVDHEDTAVVSGASTEDLPTEDLR